MGYLIFLTKLLLVIRITNVNTTNISCLTCDDGEVIIQAIGGTFEFTLNGQSFNCNSQGYNSSCEISNLPAGEYTLTIINTETGCSTTINLTIGREEGVVNDCCENGGFELGDFEGWTGGTGTVNSQGDAVISNTDLVTTNDTSTPNNHPFGDGNEAHHRILEAPYVDPTIPELPLFNDGTGKYIVRLGNTVSQNASAQNGGINGSDRLTYCFEVEECNQDFCFNHILVLEDPDHEPIETQNPFFEFSFSDAETGDVIIEPVRTFGNVNDPNFQVSGNIAYSFWTCECVDLSGYIGREVCAEFIAAGCADGGHFGYAYLDGLCSTPEDVSPQLNVDLPTAICDSENVIFDLSESFGYNQFGYKICSLNEQGEVINCYDQPLEYNDAIGTINVGEFITNQGGDFGCDQDYLIEFILSNNCTEPVRINHQFSVFCENPISINYPDIIFCGDELRDVPINGMNNCPECEISWEPSQYLDNPNSPFPMILGTLNANALDQVYTITVTDEDGCSASDNLEVQFLLEGTASISAEVIKDYCTYELIATVHYTGSNFPIGTVNVIFENETTGESFAGESNGLVSGTTSTWTFSKTFNKNEISSGTWKAVLPELQVCVDSGEAYIGYIERSDLFFGTVTFSVYPEFSPNGDGYNDIFEVQSPPSGACAPSPVAPDIRDYCSNAYYMRLRIFDGFGAKMFDDVLWADECSNFISSDLYWDGTFNGQPVNPNDVYGFSLDAFNCDDFMDPITIFGDPNSFDDDPVCDCAVDTCCEFEDRPWSNCCGVGGNVTIIL